jgi:hypothetical protein
MSCWNLDSLPELTAYDDPITKQYADRVGAVDSLVPGGGIAWVAKKTIARHRMIYCKATQGDCGGASSVPELTDAKITSIAGSLGSTAVGFAGSTGELAGFGLAAGSTALAAVTFGIGAVAAVITTIFSHHAAAVAKEENTLCLVSETYNAYAAKIEQAVASGQITVAQAQALALQVEQQLVGIMASGYKNYNAYAYYTYALKAVSLYAREQIYPQLAKPVTTQVLDAIAKPQSLALVLGGLVAAKLLLR